MNHDRQPLDARKPRAELATLALELGELARTAPERLTERLRGWSVRELAELALRLPAAARLELMLHAPKPMRLVRALPDSELYLTVRELGPADALPLLSLASAEQLEHLLDLECWRRDRFDAKRAGAWVALLLEGGEPVARRLLRLADDALLALLFQRWAGARPVELEDDIELHTLSQPESGDERGLASPDGAWRFSPVIPEHAPAIQQVARMLFLEQPERYQRVLWSAAYELPAELEEQALHWRSSRLEEHGFPPWEEALGVYAPPGGVRSHPLPLPPDDEEALAAPRLPLRLLPSRERLPAAIESLEPAQQDRTLAELIAVANRLIVADRIDPGDPSSHRESLLTAAGYVSIALEGRGAQQVDEVRRLLEEIPLIELFREGHARAVELASRVRRLAGSGWAATGPGAFALLDSPLGERLRALQGPRPLYVEIGADGPGTSRPFRSLHEIEETRAAVELAEVAGTLLVDRLGLDPARSSGSSGHGSFSTAFLTLLAWHATRRELSGDPLPPDVVADFLRDVASHRTADPAAPERALAGLVERLAAEFGLEPRQAALIRAFGRASLERLEAECGGLDPSLPPDLRAIGCLRLAAATR
jgi:hypothetical protein